MTVPARRYLDYDDCATRMLEFVGVSPEDKTPDLTVALEEPPPKHPLRFSCRGNALLGAKCSLSAMLEANIVDADQHKILHQAIARKSNIAIGGASLASRLSMLCSLLNEIPDTEVVMSVKDLGRSSQTIISDADNSSIWDTHQATETDLELMVHRNGYGIPDWIALYSMSEEMLAWLFLEWAHRRKGLLAVVHTEAMNRIFDRLAIMAASGEPSTRQLNPPVHWIEVASGSIDLLVLTGKSVDKPVELLVC